MTRSEWDLRGYLDPERYPFNDYLSEESLILISGTLYGIYLRTTLHYGGKSFVISTFILASYFSTLALTNGSLKKYLRKVRYHCVGFR